MDIIIIKHSFRMSLYFNDYLTLLKDNYVKPSEILLSNEFVNKNHFGLKVF